ncbi:MAG: carbohydrate kinase family protein [Lachnospiraceae bacterium]|nr:carbohydrate kinase family protein [Lachnospiraceae bacterium]
MKDLDVLCVGGIVCDLLLSPVGKFIFDQDKTELELLEQKLGGDAANEAIIFGRYGMKVGLAGEMGDDMTGRGLMNYMHESGVDTSNIILRGKTRTSVVMIHENGDRNFLTYGRNTQLINIHDMSMEQLKHTRMVSIGSVHILPTLDPDLPEYLEKAQAAGCITAADMMKRDPRVPEVDIPAIVAHCDYFLPSYIEAKELTGKDIPEEQADEFLAWGAKNVVIKLGEEGCLVRNAQESFRTPIYKTNAVVDTTGAGDNFVASFLTGVLKGWSHKRCAEFASAAGSICVEKVGATAAIESLAQVEARMKEQGRFSQFE